MVYGVPWAYTRNRGPGVKIAVSLTGWTITMIIVEPHSGRVKQLSENAGNVLLHNVAQTLALVRVSVVYSSLKFAVALCHALAPDTQKGLSMR